MDSHFWTCSEAHFREVKVVAHVRELGVEFRVFSIVQPLGLPIPLPRCHIAWDRTRNVLKKRQHFANGSRRTLHHEKLEQFPSQVAGSS